MSIFISCFGLVLSGAQIISELFEEGSIAGFFQHLVEPSLFFLHSMTILTIPAFMLLGYFYQKKTRFNSES